MAFVAEVRARLNSNMGVRMVMGPHKRAQVLMTRKRGKLYYKLGLEKYVNIDQGKKNNYDLFLVLYFAMCS